LTESGLLNDGWNLTFEEHPYSYRLRSNETAASARMASSWN